MDFRTRLEQGRTKQFSGEEPAELEDYIACPYFAVERGKSPVCLELRLPDGLRHAIPYSHIVEIRYDVEDGVEIYTTQKRIHISGRSLSRLFDYLIAYRVRFIQADVGIDAEEEGLFVSKIILENNL